MSASDPRKDICRLPRSTMFERMDYSRFMLRMHGFLSDAESVKVQGRIDKWLAKHGLIATEYRMKAEKVLTPNAS